MEDWQRQASPEQVQLAALIGFQKAEFITARLSEQEVQNLLGRLDGLRFVEEYSMLKNLALLSLARKSEKLGNLNHELPLAQFLIQVGAKIDYAQTVLELHPEQQSQLDEPEQYKTESVLAIAQGDLKELLEETWTDGFLA